MTKYDLSALEALKMISATEFSDFTEMDWDAFMGCESETPRIGYNGDYIIVIDGDEVNIAHIKDEFGGQLFSFKEMD